MMLNTQQVQCLKDARVSQSWRTLQIRIPPLTSYLEVLQAQNFSNVQHTIQT